MPKPELPRETYEKAAQLLVEQHVPWHGLQALRDGEPSAEQLTQLQTILTHIRGHDDNPLRRAAGAVLAAHRPVAVDGALPLDEPPFPMLPAQVNLYERCYMALGRLPPDFDLPGEASLALLKAGTPDQESIDCLVHVVSSVRAGNMRCVPADLEAMRQVALRHGNAKAFVQVR